jgi:hypothetical protein
MKLTPLSQKYANSLLKLVARCGVTDDSMTLSMRDTLYQIYTQIYFELKDSNKLLLQEVLPKINVYKKSIRERKSIPKPEGFDSAYFIPEYIRKQIVKEAAYFYTCKTSLDYGDFKRDIRINIIRPKNADNFLKVEWVIYKMLQWLFVLGQNANPRCGKELTVYFYDTEHFKLFPVSNKSELGVENVNSAYADVCSSEDTIVIFRREEWLKVFIHECFHALGLDFASIDVLPLEKKLKKIYGLDIDYLPTEAYAETWARILNIMSVAFDGSLESNTVESKKMKDFIENVVYMTQIERIFSVVQAVRVLSFYGMDYNSLFVNHDNNYKEDTGVFAYYIETAVLMINFDKFLNFCYTNNLTLFQFRFTPETIRKYTSLINKLSKSSKTMATMYCVLGMIPNVILKDGRLRMTTMEIQ